MRLFLLLPLAACHIDGLATNGELGRLGFSLTSAWYLDPTQLTEVDIVTGHEQRIQVDLTSAGEADAKGQAGSLTFHITPDDGVTLHDTEEDDENADPAVAPSVELLVRDPGTYTLEARLDGEVFDLIDLGFDAPDALELAAFVRDPWAEDFAGADEVGPLQVQEGAQLAWLTIPLNAGGVRLAGRLETFLSAEPLEAVVPAENVYHVNEDTVTSSVGLDSLYFIAPGEVVVTVADTVSVAKADLSITVVE